MKAWIYLTKKSNVQNAIEKSVLFSYVPSDSDTRGNVVIGEDIRAAALFNVPMLWVDGSSQLVDDNAGSAEIALTSGANWLVAMTDAFNVSR